MSYTKGNVIDNRPDALKYKFGRMPTEYGGSSKGQGMPQKRGVNRGMNYKGNNCSTSDYIFNAAIFEKMKWLFNDVHYGFGKFYAPAIVFFLDAKCRQEFIGFTDFGMKEDVMKLAEIVRFVEVSYGRSKTASTESLAPSSKACKEFLGLAKFATSTSTLKLAGILKDDEARQRVLVSFVETLGDAIVQARVIDYQQAFIIETPKGARRIKIYINPTGRPMSGQERRKDQATEFIDLTNLYKKIKAKRAEKASQAEAGGSRISHTLTGKSSH